MVFLSSLYLSLSLSLSLLSLSLSLSLARSLPFLSCNISKVYVNYLSDWYYLAIMLRFKDDNFNFHICTSLYSYSLNVKFNTYIIVGFCKAYFYVRKINIVVKCDSSEVEEVLFFCFCAHV